jgi:hypothetical protein
MDAIDFVVTWVDGGDPAWQAEKASHTGGARGDDRAIRYRDWDNLRYMFRAFEKFTPWVNRVHFVTWGHLPPWMNEASPKLHIVNHRDFIPAQYLPTFNSNAIELNMHRIPGLSEQFVYFNDDMFILRPMGPERFFKGGLPADCAVLFPYPSDARGSIGCIVSNNMDLINANFKRGEMLRANPSNFFNLRYGPCLRYTFAALPFPHIVGFWRSHYDNAYLKRTFETLWAKEPQALDATSRNKVRTGGDINHWLMRYWQLASGQFTPSAPGKKRYFALKNDNSEALGAIRRQTYDVVCLNDREVVQDFEAQKRLFQQAFESILPDKCGFEK